MNLVFKVLNYELYHSEDNVFVLVKSSLREWGYSFRVLWEDNKLYFVNDENKLDIPKYVQKRAREVIPKFFKPFKIYDTVVYKDKEYTIIDTNGKAKINGEWKDVISYIAKFGKVKYHREKEDFISKFKLI